MAETISVMVGDPRIGETSVLPKMTEEEKAEVREIMAKTKDLIQGLQKCPVKPENQIAKFDLLLGWQWRLELEGIDAFLVKRVEFPKYVRERGDDVYSFVKKQRKLTVYLHEAIAPATYQQVEEMILGTFMFPRTGTLHYVNSRGDTVRARHFSGIRVDEMECSPLDYGSKDPLEIKLVLSYEAERQV
jgi:hypothetical protein